MATANSHVGKKIINDPCEVVNDAVEGLLLANRNVSLLQDYRVVIRSDVEELRRRGQVTIVGGGGSGHEPWCVGYVGYGALTATVPGEVFTAPSVKPILAAIRAVGKENEGGVLLILANYTGDKLLFGMAAERAKQEGIKVEIVIVDEDCALSSEIDTIAGRRGLCGNILIIKIAGSMAEEGKSLEEMVPFLRNTVKAMGTMGVCLSPCSIPGSEPTFHLGHDEMELGLGLHGEKGVACIKLLTAKALVKRLVDHMSTPAQSCRDKVVLNKGDKVCLIVNNLGATSQMELFIVVKEAVNYLVSEKGVMVDMVYAGTFVTSLEMAGVSLTILHLTDERQKHLESKTAIPAWQTVFGDGIIKQCPFVSPTPDVSKPLDKACPISDTGKVLHNCLMKITETFEQNEEYLNALDRSAGDGDTGSTFKRAAIGIRKALENREIPCNSPYQALLAMASVLEENMGGTSGALYGIFVVGGASELKNETTPKQWCNALGKGIQMVKSYGGAKEGQRTMLDALCPAFSALEKAVDCGHGGQGALREAIKAADDGAQNTCTMKAVAGRASYITSNMLTEPDAGAVAVWLWLKAVGETLSR